MSPAYPAFGLLSCPLSPRPPSPPGKGENQSFLMQGASPLASPTLDRLRHLQSLPLWCPQGGLPSLSPAYPAFTFFFAPYPPDPLPRRGRGRLFSLFRRGLRPRHPCIKPFAALTASAMRAPRARSLRFAAKTIGSGSLLAVPAAKERGDRGRWNYPSQATAAFEMVLSPGAGRASAAGGSSPLRHCSGRDSQCRRGLAAPPGTTAAGTASAAGGKLPPPPSKIFLPPPIFIFCSPIYGILKQEKPEGV